MGLKGSEAAREASDFVLADDNFASIAEAVKQGRTVYANLKKVITFLFAGQWRRIHFADNRHPVRSGAAHFAAANTLGEHDKFRGFGYVIGL